MPIKPKLRRHNYDIVCITIYYIIHDNSSIKKLSTHKRSKYLCISNMCNQPRLRHVPTFYRSCTTVPLHKLNMPNITVIPPMVGTNRSSARYKSFITPVQINHADVAESFKKGYICVKTGQSYMRRVFSTKIICRHNKEVLILKQ